MNTHVAGRPGKVTVNDFMARYYDTPPGEQDCLVLDLMQEGDNEGTDVVFVCQLFNGKVITTGPAGFQFTDSDKYNIQGPNLKPESEV